MCNLENVYLLNFTALHILDQCLFLATTAGVLLCVTMLCIVYMYVA